MPGIERLAAPPPTAELVIVGAGIMGAATAFAARRAGLRPLVLEARPAPASATTAVATGAYRLQHDDPDELALAQETLAAFRDFASFTGQDTYGSGVIANGRVHATCTDEGAAAQRALRDRQAALGVTGVELVGGDEARARWPFLGPAVR
jgi:D-hydroxyproline dehydrogenase subunit beta